MKPVKEFDTSLETINITFSNPSYTMAKVTISNFPIEGLKDINEDYTIELHLYQYYLHKLYDHIKIVGFNYIITNAAQKSVTLLCTGINVINIEAENKVLYE